MPIPVLRPDEAQALTVAAQLLAAGRAQEAAGKVAPLIANGLRHPDVLMVYSAACARLGKARDALGACQAALEAAPERADITANLGRMLHEQGQSARGAELLERAVQIDPVNAGHWYNLGIAASGADDDVPTAVETVGGDAGRSDCRMVAWSDRCRDGEQHCGEAPHVVLRRE